MKITDFLPKDNSILVSGIFYFANTYKNENKADTKDLYVNSIFYGTNKLLISSSYKPIIIL